MTSEPLPAHSEANQLQVSETKLTTIKLQDKMINLRATTKTHMWQQIFLVATKNTLKVFQITVRLTIQKMEWHVKTNN